MNSSYMLIPSDYKPVIGERCQWKNVSDVTLGCCCWEEGFYIGNSQDGHKIMESNDGIIEWLDTTDYDFIFKPVKSNKQKFVEAGKKVNMRLGIGHSIDCLFEALHDAGFKAPDKTN